MNISEYILLTLRYSDQNMIAGRTLFQKTLYFIEEKLKLDFGFVAHYYGPYSNIVSDELADLCASGIVEESKDTLSPFSYGISFEPRKYTYKLTDSGQNIARFIEQENKFEAQQVKEILDAMKKLGASDDYKSLSVAAKMHHILKHNTEGMKPSEILTEAEALDWTISQEEADAAVEFLYNMDLVKVAEKKQKAKNRN